jgi:plasmid maintenance system killer protein
MALALTGQQALGQVEVKGTVYDRSQLFAMPGVSVLGTSGAGTMTDSTGHYSIRLNSGDSIYFSYLGKFTTKFPVKRIAPGYPFNMSLAVNVDSLPLVVVRPKLYRYDSAENREEYRRVFDYQPDDPLGNGNGGVGFNLDILFNGRKNRQMLALQRRLVEEERDKYIDHRFNKILVKKITGLKGAALDTFMRVYRPSYEFILGCENDYEFLKYIKDCGLYFSRTRKEEHPD